MGHGAWSKKIKYITKNIFISFLLSLIFATASHGITLLELNLREVRDNYRHSPYEGMQKIEKLWNDFPGINDRVQIFLDLNHYYQKHSMDKLLLSQGKWLLKNNIPSEKSRIWILIPIAETLAKQKYFEKAVHYYDKAFMSGCVLLGKNPESLSREDFISTGANGISLWGRIIINASLIYARAHKFNDAFIILNSAKVINSNGVIKPEVKDIEYERTRINILLIQGKSEDARQTLKLLNEGKPYLTIEPDTIQPPEEELCLKDKDYGLLTNIYLNTLIINPPCDQITFKKIIYNARSTIYVLDKLLDLFKKEDFRIAFEKEIKENLNGPNLPHINLLFAEYYFYRKDNKQAAYYYQAVIKQGKRQMYRWPIYYPDLDPNENYRFPHRTHLWVTCYERAKYKLSQLKK